MTSTFWEVDTMAGERQESHQCRNFAAQILSGKAPTQPASKPVRKTHFVVQ
jgi:hypothetical protein